MKFFNTEISHFNIYCIQHLCVYLQLELNGLDMNTKVKPYETTISDNHFHSHTIQG